MSAKGIHKEPHWITRSELSRAVKASPPSITEAVQKGLLVTAAPDRSIHFPYIDPRHPVNVRWIEATCLRRGVPIPACAKPVNIRSTPVDARPPKFADHDPEVVFADPDEDTEDDKLIQQLNENGYGTSGLIDYQIEKTKAQTAMLNAKLAETLKLLVRRTFVDKVIGRIGTVIVDHLFSMSDRVSKELAGEFGETTPERTIIIKKIIDQDVSRSIEALKRVIRDEYEKEVDE